MHHEIHIALSLMKSNVSRLKLVNSNVLLSTSGIIIGVAVLILTLTIYDGYMKKLETIIFSIFPQVTIKSTSGLIAAEDSKEMSEDDFFNMPSSQRDVRENCKSVCDGAQILSDNSSETVSSVQSSYVLNPDKASKILTALTGQKAIKRYAPVILEGGKFEVVLDSGKEGMEEKFRILGINLEKNIITPEVHRLLTDDAVLEKLREPDTVIISDVLYKKLFAQSPVTKNSPVFKARIMMDASERESTFPTGFVPLRVVGSFNLGIHRVADNMIITGLHTADKLLGMSGHVSMIGISLHEPMQADAVGDSIRETLEQHGVIETSVFNWRMFGDDIFNSMTLYRRMIIITLALSLIITAFNIYNNLSILILERRRQIGVMLAMGMKRGSIYRVFLIISQLEAVVGSVIGLGLGLLIGIGFNDYLNQSIGNFLPVQQSQVTLRLDVSLGIMAFVCIVSAVTALLSARRANSLDVVEALQAD